MHKNLVDKKEESIFKKKKQQESEPTAPVMNIITQLVILTLSLLLVNADEQCDSLLHGYTTNASAVLINSCCDLRKYTTSNGVYKMSMGTFFIANVYCDMTVECGGGWIVIQRNRKNSRQSFNMNWREYEDGFGDLNNDFWAGLKLIHCLTQIGQWEMRVDYRNNGNIWSHLHYNQFSVGSAIREYPLTVGGFTGVGVNRFTSHPLNGMKFSTPDNDNDRSNGNCAANHKSGWWYNNCRHININSQPPNVFNGVLFTEMKIRPKDCITN